MKKRAGIYTRFGDKGQTRLGNKEVVSKASCRIEVIGGVDELNVAIGMILHSISISFNLSEPDKKFLKGLQEDLFVIGAELACGNLQIEVERVALIEEKIDEITADLPELKNFILPGGSLTSMHFHYSRVICRRVERSIVRLHEEEYINPDIISYFNRLSDLCFVFARRYNENGKLDVIWKPE